MDAANAAVDEALRKLEIALNAVIDAVTAFLKEASTQLFTFLDEATRGLVQPILEPIRSAVDQALSGLQRFGRSLKDSISEGLETIKDIAKGVVRDLGEVLGPVWQWIKDLWSLFFGEELEHCELTRQWFEERMRRTEQLFL